MNRLLLTVSRTCLTSLCGLLVLQAAEVNHTAVAASQPGVLVGCPDPAIIRASDGSGYYIFATGRGTAVWRSPDLIAWNRASRVFAENVPAWAKSMVPASKGIWAPDVAHFQKLYHLYYSVSSFGSQRSVIGLAVNRTLDPSSPDYLWEDRGLVIESDPQTSDFNAIDPALFVDRDGTPYLFWGSYWSGIKAVQIDPKTGKPDATHPEIRAVASRAKDADPPAIEAPYVVFRDGWYYLLVSYDFCCAGKDSTYKVMVGRSKSVLGPYVGFQQRRMADGAATLVLSSHDRWRGPGHCSIQHTDQGDRLVHHVYDADFVSRGRILQIRPLYWLEDGWPVAGEPLPLGTEAREPQKPLTVTGTWTHQVDYLLSQPIDLQPDGTIDGVSSPGRWKREGSQITFQWEDANAPSGVWVDRVLLEPDSQSYIGRNQRGQVIRGVRR